MRTGEQMKNKRTVGIGLGLLLLVITTGCINVEQEVFLNADGSGEFMIHLSFPDLPDDMKAKAQDASGGKDFTAEIEKMRQELTASMPPTVKVKEMKAVRQNGVQGFYIVMQFKTLKDMTDVLAKFGKESFKESELKDQPDWHVELKKLGDKWSYASSFYLNVDEEKKPEEKKPGADQQSEKVGDDLSKQLLPLLMGTVRLRFVLHTPAPITETNADLVMRDNIAVWNCSLASFVKEKKPIQMRATF
jgi:hypothetical protein